MKSELNKTALDILRYPHPVLKSSHLRKGIRQITIQDRKFVLYRDNEGNPVALPDVCPHRGALLSKGKMNTNRELVCAYHAWRISANGKVSCPSVPAKKCRIAVLKTWDKYGYIWITNADVTEDAFPEFLQPGFDLIGSFTSDFKAPLKVVLDNFGEIEHAFQVHSFIGPSSTQLDTVKFSVKIEEDKTFGFLSCKYRKLPFFFKWFYGFKSDDLYHNDWEFKFNPLHGSYSNYWTNPAETKRRPISFIITSFLVPVSEQHVRVQVFVQISVKGWFLKLIKPILNFVTMAITKFEINADSHIASFAPDISQDGSSWQLTHFDKQIMANRKRLQTLYYGETSEKVLNMHD